MSERRIAPLAVLRLRADLLRRVGLLEDHRNAVKGYFTADPGLLAECRQEVDRLLWAAACLVWELERLGSEEAKLSTEEEDGPAFCPECEGLLFNGYCRRCRR
jgi:hypothetical protein